jgi:hypothetical protein
MERYKVFMSNGLTFEIEQAIADDIHKVLTEIPKQIDVNGKHIMSVRYGKSVFIINLLEIYAVVRIA